MTEKKKISIADLEKHMDEDNPPQTYKMEPSGNIVTEKVGADEGEFVRLDKYEGIKSLLQDVRIWHMKHTNQNIRAEEWWDEGDVLMERIDNLLEK